MRCLVVAAACALHAPAHAELYKCHEGGRVSYSDRPCAGAGAPFAVRAAPAPDPDAAARLERARATLLALEKTRAEQSQVDERAERAAQARRTLCDKLRLQRRWADEDLARSRGDARDAARIKARRQAETLALQCPA